MTSSKANEVLEEILEEIQLPDSAYESAEQRYKSIHEWMVRDESTCVGYSPHVYSSGSFRLGTANKPLGGAEEYDLDIVCEFKIGLKKDEKTQAWLKKLLGDELDLYRTANGVKKPLDERHRCWRLDYADKLKFHLDVVPSVPESATRMTQLRESMILASRLEKSLAADVAELAISITDDRHPNYRVVTPDWLISNPAGYAKWFESRMKVAEEVVAFRESIMKASLEHFPRYQWKLPLQQVVQILKRHRDTMYENNDDCKPISIIITTLAAKAYQGEADLASAMESILAGMGNCVNSAAPYVPNPVNPAEDFADKWDSPDHAKYRLKENFYKWLNQAKLDFAQILDSTNTERIVETAKEGLSLSLNKSRLNSLFGAPLISTPARKISGSEPRPWFNLKKRK